MFPRKPSTLNVQFEDGNLRFSSSDHLSTGYGQAEFPITLRIDVEKGGEILSVDSVSGTTIQKTFKVGPEVRITEFRVEDSWMQLKGDFLITPWLIASSNSVSSLSQASANVWGPFVSQVLFLGVIDSSWRDERKMVPWTKKWSRLPVEANDNLCSSKALDTAPV